MSTGDHQRTSRKKDRTSSTNNAGCSNAAKWPPLAGSFQYRMFGNRRSAHRRDGRCSYRAITRMSDSAREGHVLRWSVLDGERSDHSFEARADTALAPVR